MMAAMVARSELVVGVDASRNRSGGAIAHIKGLMASADPSRYGIGRVHLWGYEALLDQVPAMNWLVKHLAPCSNGSMLEQLAWQRWALPRAARENAVDVMFNTDAGSVCGFRPSATLSQDMLSFEPGEIDRYPWGGRARLRLELLKRLQLLRLRESDVSVFLSEHARKVIGSMGGVRQASVVPHGVDVSFREAAGKRRVFPQEGPLRCIYVSNAAPYKHQWKVIEAVSLVRGKTNRDVKLQLVGGGSGAALERTLKAVSEFDPERAFVELVDFLPNGAMPDVLARADLFVFASSCENLPITLLEGMASGLPIACSNKGPMPEVLGDGGIYFEPEDPAGIAAAICQIMTDENVRTRIVKNSIDRASAFTWEKCSAQTWQVLADAARMVK